MERATRVAGHSIEAAEVTFCQLPTEANQDDLLRFANANVEHDPLSTSPIRRSRRLTAKSTIGRTIQRR
jgi:hypothetical protein